jgi:hypothetical protein
MQANHAIGEFDAADRDLPHAAHSQAKKWKAACSGTGFRGTGL